MITRESIIKAYCKIREIDSSIPDEVLNFMKDASIKSLESQLSNNPLQLTCETCNYFSWDGRGIGQCHNCSPQCPRYTLTDFGCIFHTKDTK